MKRKNTPLCTADYTQPAINIYLERLGLIGYKDAIDAALLQCEQNNVSPRQAVEQILAVIAKCRDSQKIEMLMDGPALPRNDLGKLQFLTSTNQAEESFDRAV